MNWLGGRTVNAVVVSTRSGQALKGAMVERNRDGVTLRMAYLGGENEQHQEIWQRLDGDVFVPASNVDFIQQWLDVGILGLPPNLQPR